jgi:hypothetical protein
VHSEEEGKMYFEAKLYDSNNQEVQIKEDNTVFWKWHSPCASGIELEDSTGAKISEIGTLAGNVITGYWLENTVIGHNVL